MSLFVVGVNHQTAPVEVRGRLSAGFTTCGQAPNRGFRSESLSEVVAVSTCNRLEVYAVPRATQEQAEEMVLDRLAGFSGLSAAELHEFAYVRGQAEAVRHLLRVSCGLDSQILGEAQILGQISESFVSARTGGTIGPILTLVLSRALHAGRRARSETLIGSGRTSISQAAAHLVEKELGGLPGKRIAIVGAGESAELAMRALATCGAPDVSCISRSVDAARAVPGLEACKMLPWSSLREALLAADAVITATSAPHPVLYTEDLAPILAERGERGLVIVDIAVPRDVDPRVRDLPQVTLHDIDELEAGLDEGRALREQAVPSVEAIVLEESAQIEEWLKAREIAPTIRLLQKQARFIADAEAQRTVAKLNGIDLRQQELVFRMARRIAKKILHEPTVRLKSRADEDLEDYAEALAELFGLRAETKPAARAEEKGNERL